MVNLGTEIAFIKQLKCKEHLGYGKDARYQFRIQALPLNLGSWKWPKYASGRNTHLESFSVSVTVCDPKVAFDEEIYISRVTRLNMD